MEYIKYFWQYAEPIMVLTAVISSLVLGYVTRHWILGFKNMVQSACGVYIPKDCYDNPFVQEQMSLSDEEKKKPYVIRWALAKMTVHPNTIGSWPQATIDKGSDMKAAYHSGLKEDLNITNTKPRKVHTLGPIKMPSRNIQIRVHSGILKILNPIERWWLSRGKYYSLYVGFTHINHLEAQSLQRGPNVKGQLFLPSSELEENFINYLCYYHQDGKELEQKARHVIKTIGICQKSELNIVKEFTEVPKKREPKEIKALLNRIRA